MRNVHCGTKHNKDERKCRHDEHRIMSTTIRVLQHNCARSSNVMYSLLNTAEKDIDIIIIQKPWISRDGNLISHASFNSYIANNNNERACTAIYVSNVH